jgi:hypothetical protein
MVNQPTLSDFLPRTVVADPPWTPSLHANNPRRATLDKAGPQKHYETLSLEAIIGRRARDGSPAGGDGATRLRSRRPGREAMRPDMKALPVLDYYRSLCVDDKHREAIQDRIDEFQAYRDTHADRMKEPGITGHILLNREIDGTKP